MLTWDGPHASRAREQTEAGKVAEVRGTNGSAGETPAVRLLWKDLASSWQLAERGCVQKRSEVACKVWHRSCIAFGYSFAIDMFPHANFKSCHEIVDHYPYHYAFAFHLHADIDRTKQAKGHASRHPWPERRGGGKDSSCS